MSKTDISGLSNIGEIYENSLIKKWIKLISIDDTISLKDYNRNNYFIPVVNIVLDNEVFKAGKKIGKKKRNTLIKLEPNYFK